MSHERPSNIPHDEVVVKRNEILQNLLERDPDKYAGTVSGLRRSFVLFVAVDGIDIGKMRKRSDLFKTYYVLQRMMDDYGDGDMTLPAGFKASSYVKQKIQRLNGIPPQESPDIVDLMYQKCNGWARNLGFSIENETRSIYNSILFDAKRREHFLETGKFKLHSTEELTVHFIQSDTLGCIGGMLSLFGDDASRARLIEPAGWADRARMTIEDLPADIRAGLINIPHEDLEKYSISLSELMQTAKIDIMIDAKNVALLPSSIRAWTNDYALEGLRKLDEQEKILSKNSFKWIGKKILLSHYMNPDRKYFESFISQKLRMTQGEN
jgi:hypothetical protein